MEKSNIKESTSDDVSRLPCVGYLGPEGTFTHEAALILFGEGAVLKGTDTIEDVFELEVKNTIGFSVIDDCVIAVISIDSTYTYTCGILIK